MENRPSLLPAARMYPSADANAQPERHAFCRNSSTCSRRSMKTCLKINSACSRFRWYVGAGVLALMTVYWGRVRSNATFDSRSLGTPASLGCPNSAEIPDRSFRLPLAADLSQVTQHLKKNIPTRLTSDQSGDRRRQAFRYTFDLIKAGDPKPPWRAMINAPLAAPGAADDENPKVSLSDGRIFVTRTIAATSKRSSFPDFICSRCSPSFASAFVPASFRAGIIRSRRDRRPIRYHTRARK